MIIQSIFSRLSLSQYHHELKLSFTYVTDSLSYIYKRFYCYCTISKKINFLLSCFVNPGKRYQTVGISYQVSTDLSYLRLQSDGLSVYVSFFNTKIINTCNYYVMENIYFIIIQRKISFTIAQIAYIKQFTVLFRCWLRLNGSLPDSYQS